MTFRTSLCFRIYISLLKNWKILIYGSCFAKIKIIMDEMEVFLLTASMRLRFLGYNR